MVSAAGTITSGSNVSGSNILTGGIVSATGVVYGSNHIGSGAGLTNINGANVTGTVPSATTAGTASTVTSGAQPAITSVGSLSSTQISSLGVGTGPSGTSGEIRATDNITGYYTSDIKFKENIQDIADALHIVTTIGSKTFDWSDEFIAEHGGADGYFIQKNDFGVVAQDVQKVFPRAIRTRPDGSLAVDYEKLSTLAFGAISALLARIEALENKNNT